MFSKDMANENVRANMIQEIVGLLQELTKEASDIYYLPRLVDTGVRRIEVFCEYPATCSPDISVGKHAKGKAPAGSMITSVLLSSKYDTKNLQFVEHGRVWPN